MVAVLKHGELARLRTEELWVAWLSREETASELDEWLRAAREESHHHHVVGLSSSPPGAVFMPWGSPRRSPPSPQDHRRKVPLSQQHPLPSLRRRSGSLSVPEDESLVSRWRAVAGDEDRLSLIQFAPMAAEVCELPLTTGPVIFQRVREIMDDDGECDDGREDFVSLSGFLAFYSLSKMSKLSKEHERLFAVLSRSGKGVGLEDFEPLVNFVVKTHPGLAFLEAHEEFQLKYAATVAYRIFYRINLSRTGAISKRELAKSEPSLLAALRTLETNDDINAELSYFSYEHFYVLYCQFWELDLDKDGLLGRNDLLKYGGHRLSRAIVDRVFQAAPRPPSQHQMMSYGDFVYFMLSEEDKTTEASVRYWFGCVDVDGDGEIDSRDCRNFYDVQAQRMECLGHEVVALPDVLCQMADLVDGPFTLKNFLSKRPGVFFDALFSLDKFLAFEQRDPFAERLKRDDPFETDWDRFAAAEYSRLATADDDDDDDGPDSTTRIVANASFSSNNNISNTTDDDDDDEDLDDAQPPQDHPMPDTLLHDGD